MVALPLLEATPHNDGEVDVDLEILEEGNALQPRTRTGGALTLSFTAETDSTTSAKTSVGGDI